MAQGGVHVPGEARGQVFPSQMASQEGLRHVWGAIGDLDASLLRLVCGRDRRLGYSIYCPLARAGIIFISRIKGFYWI